MEWFDITAAADRFAAGVGVGRRSCRLTSVTVRADLGHCELTSATCELTSGTRELTSATCELTSAMRELTSERHDVTSNVWRVHMNRRRVPIAIVEVISERYGVTARCEEDAGRRVRSDGREATRARDGRRRFRSVRDLTIARTERMTRRWIVTARSDDVTGPKVRAAVQRLRFHRRRVRSAADRGRHAESIVDGTSGNCD